MRLIGGVSASGGVSTGRSAPSMVASSSSPPTAVPDRTRISCSGYLKETRIPGSKVAPRSSDRSGPPISLSVDSAWISASVSLVWQNGFVNLFSSVVYDNLRYAFSGIYDLLSFSYSSDTSPSLMPPASYLVSGGGGYTRDPDLLPRNFNLHAEPARNVVDLWIPPGTSDFNIGLRCE